MPLDRALICQEKLQKVMTDERLHILRTPLVAALPRQTTLSQYSDTGDGYSSEVSNCTPGPSTDSTVYEDQSSYVDILSQALHNLNE